MERIIRSIVDNVLSGMKAGFKAILNLEHPIERKKMFIQKGSSKLSATLLALILGASVFMAGQVWAAKYVTDPSTGKVVSAPEYGGILTYSQPYNPPSFDVYIHYDAMEVVGVVVERLTIADWALDRDLFNYRTSYMPDFVWRGHLAESWETPDPLTIIFKIRKGVKWHDKAPMNGRELTAKDIEYNWHRYLGLGSGYTEPNPKYGSRTFGQLPWESITATDRYTFVIKLTKADPDALRLILSYPLSSIYPPEVIKEHGDLSDWRNLVGTGPFELTDWVEGSALILKKNPDYWGYDEKYPENRLPYVDGLEMLVMPELATRMAALRSGKIDGLAAFLGWSQIKSMDQVDSLKKTNPELVIEPFSFRSMSSFAPNSSRPPFDDVRVRHALQMALDLDTINAAYWKGYADTTPQGYLGAGIVGYVTPFADWPEEVKGYYTYDPERAEALLDEAGYPRGANGIRFETVYGHLDRGDFDLDYFQIVMEYLRAVGIDIEVRKLPVADWGSYVRDSRGEGLFLNVHNTDYITGLNSFYSTGYNPSNVNDSTYDAILDAFRAATTTEEQQRLAKDAVMRVAEQHWTIAGPRVPSFMVTQPWLVGYSGEVELGEMDRAIIFSRLWIDSALKKEMGF